MSIQQDISYDHHWHRNELKSLDIVVYEDDGVTAVNLNAIADVEWRLLHNGHALLEKDKAAGITISGAPVANVAEVTILVADYASIPTTTSHFRHELWDRTNDRQLVFGAALLQEGSA